MLSCHVVTKRPWPITVRSSEGEMTLQRWSEGLLPIPPHQPVTEYRQTSGRERKLGLNAKSNSRNEPLISLFTKHLHTSTEITEPLAIFPLGILYLQEVWFLLCLQNILCPTVMSAIVVIFISLNHRHERTVKLTERNVVWTIFLKRQLLLWGVTGVLKSLNTASLREKKTI